MTAIVK